VSVKRAGLDGQTWETPSPLSEVIVGKAFDISPPAPAQWQSAQWIKLDATGNEHSWANTVNTFIPAIKLVWTGATVDVETLVQKKASESLVWENVTGWQTGVQEHIDKQVDVAEDYQYRVRSRRGNGQTSLSATTSVPRV
jgi:hypothetical protein